MRLKSKDTLHTASLTGTLLITGLAWYLLFGLFG